VISYVSDEFEILVKELESASEKYDIVVTTGSTAHGPRDYLHDAINKLSGQILVDEVAVRPGHPQLLAQINEKPLLGLPGNPQSAVAGLMTLGRSYLDGVFGRELEVLEEIHYINENNAIYVQEGFTRMVLGTSINGHFHPSKYLGSAMLRGFAESNGFAILSNPASAVRWIELPA